MHIKERLLFLPIGQGGGNIGVEFEENHYNTLFINTSNDDLESIPGRHKYHVPGAYGCSKNKGKALMYAQDYYSSMINMIDQTFPRQDIVYFIFTGGGGTGAGLGPILLDILSNKNLNKIYNAIFVLPSLKESKQALENSIETYEELLKIKRLKNLIVLDNNKRERMDINKQIYKDFDRLVNATEKNQKGIIDPAEVETIITSQGTSIMLNISDETDRAWQFEQSLKNSIYADFEKGCKFIATIKSKNLDMEHIQSKVGVPQDIFEGYTATGSFIAVSGMPYPVASINKIQERISELSKLDQQLDNRQTIKLDIPKKQETTFSTEAKLDVTDIFKKYMKK